MDHPQIPRQIDLGQCLLRASNSHLQLQFAVTARFSPQKGCDSTGSPVNVNQWEDLSSAWVSEAPELDIGLSIKTAPDMEHAASGLAAALGDKLCTSPVCMQLQICDTLFKHWLIILATDLVRSRIRRSAQELGHCWRLQHPRRLLHQNWSMSRSQNEGFAKRHRLTCFPSRPA